MSYRKLPPRRTDEECRELATAWIGGRVVTGDDVATDDRAVFGAVFLPVSLGCLAGYRRAQYRHLFIFGIIGKHRDCGRNVNGKPMFAECAVWRRTDAARAAEMARKAMAAMGAEP